MPQRLNSVMCHLRSVGYDAAICKSCPKDNSRSFPSDHYDYLDVILKSTKSGKTVLFVDLNSRMQLEIARPTKVDVEFRMQFEMSRPTREYSPLLELPPNIYMGRGDRLQCIVKIYCECMKNSLKKTGMYIQVHALQVVRFLQENNHLQF